MTSNMFHPGDLQSGIGLAIQQSKLVTCFVYEDNDASSETWETTFLPPLTTLIAEKTVLLKIKLHSQEAGFLSAFCPIQQAPTLAVIDNARVVDKIEGDLRQEEWEGRFKKALAVRDSDPEAKSGQLPQDDGQQAPTSSSPTTSGANAQEDEEKPTTEQPASDTTSQPTLQSLLPDRASRLEADQAAKRAKEKAERIAKAEARRKEKEAVAGSDGPSTLSEKAKGKQRANPSDDATQQSRRDWVKEQAKRKEEAKLERKRILQQIEADRQARKDREAIRKEAFAPAMSSLAETAPSANTQGDMCALQLRLFDGTSIKTRFTSSTTLAIGVRTWIKETAPPGAADTPYSFRLMLAPNPSRTVDKSEEEKSLQDLGFVPSATLVLVPSLDSVASTSDGFLSRGLLGSAYGLVSGAFGIVGSAFGYITGGRGGGPYIGGIGDETEPSNIIGATMAGADSTSAVVRKRRTKNLADQRAEATAKDQSTEFYNGNSSAFEGRKDNDMDE